MVASFVVKELQPLSVLKMLIAQTMHIKYFGEKIKNAYCLQWTGVVGFFVLILLSHRRCCLSNDVTLTEGLPFPRMLL